MDVDTAQRVASDVEILAQALSDTEVGLALEPAADIASIEALVERARETGDDALLGRALSVMSRAQVVLGEYAAALQNADDALVAFARLDLSATVQWSGSRAEALACGGTALSKLDRIGEALPRLEEAVGVAQAGIDALTDFEDNASYVFAQSALVRSVGALGVGRFAIREIDTAIVLYDRGLAIADAASHTWNSFVTDRSMIRSNLVEALHNRARQYQAAGEPDIAAADIAAARAVLDSEAWRIADNASQIRTVTQSRSSYYVALGHHLLLTAKPREAYAMFERELIEVKRFADERGLAEAQVGLALAAFELGSPRESLAHASAAIEALYTHEDCDLRATVLLVCAKSHRELGEDVQAYEALEAHHALRTHREHVAALEYASHMTAQLELERVRAEAQSQRRVAAMLATLGRIGQEITANLDAVAVFQIFTKYIGDLLSTTSFTVWLLDAAGERLMLALGIEAGRAIAANDIPVDDPQSLAARVVRERREVAGVMPNAGPEPGGTPGLQTTLCAPLIVADRILGVVSIGSDNPIAFTEHERLILRSISTYAAIAIDNASAYSKLEQTVATLRATQRELSKRTEEFERLSLTDALTGVANRRQLHERAQVEIAGLQRKPGVLAVAMFDIDHFKRVNDTYGHAVGDVVLQQVALVAKEWLRPADLIARVGGEEFALLLPGAGIREALTIAERIRSSIAALVVVSGDASVRVTSSFGVALYDAAYDTLDHALSRADGALYAAKLAGRNRVHAAPNS